MRKATLEYARQIIAAQKKHAADPRAAQGQKGYADGLEKMLEIILTEAYTKEI